MVNLYDIVYCTSGSGQPYVGYVYEVYSNNEVVIKWWEMNRNEWSETIRFNALEAGVIVLGPMPDHVEFL